MDARQGSAAGSAPATDEIEITPEMIEAGAAEVACYSPEETTAAEVAAEVFRAMLRVQRLMQESSASPASRFLGSGTHHRVVV